MPYTLLRDIIDQQFGRPMGRPWISTPHSPRQIPAMSMRFAPRSRLFPYFPTIYFSGYCNKLFHFRVPKISNSSPIHGKFNSNESENFLLIFFHWCVLGSSAFWALVVREVSFKICQTGYNRFCKFLKFLCRSWHNISRKWNKRRKKFKLLGHALFLWKIVWKNRNAM